MPEAEIIIMLKSLIKRTAQPVIGELEDILRHAYSLIDRNNKLEMELAKCLAAIAFCDSKIDELKGGE